MSDANEKGKTHKEQRKEYTYNKLKGLGQEIIEEILLLDEPVRRLRTTLWEKTSYGKSSKSIRYKKLPIGKKLAKAIENTKKEAYRDR